MDLSTTSLLSGLVIGSIGLFYFMYGKNTQNFLLLFIGLGMMVYPYFISSQLILWSLTAALCFFPLWLKHHA